jgi:cysteinyl-tRNA synthetase
MDRQDLAERLRPDLNGGEVLIDPQLASLSDQVPSLDCLESSGIRPAALRYAGLTAQPTVPWCVSWTALASAQSALDTLQMHLSALPATEAAATAPAPGISPLRERFTAALADDLDTSTALAVLWQAARADLPAGERRDLLVEFGQVLGLDLASGSGASQDELPEGAQRLIEHRAAARQRRDWALADDLRQQLAAMDVEAQDGPDGSVYLRGSGVH